LLFAAITAQVWGTEGTPQGFIYQMVEAGYMDQPMQTPYGIVATNDRQSEIYLLQEGQLRTLVAAPGCGRYITLNANRSLIGFKLIDENEYQVPAILDLRDGEIWLLEDYAFQCGQVSFSHQRDVAYTYNNDLIVLREDKKETFPLGFYTNIARISPDGRYVAMTHRNGMPIVLDTHSGKWEEISDVDALYEPKWNEDGSRILWERTDGDLYVIDPMTHQTTCLGAGWGGQWSDERTIVFSRSHYRNNDVFFFTGISVRSIRWDGSHEVEIVPKTMDCPQQIGLDDQGALLIAYSYNNRCLVRWQEGKEEVLYTLPTNEHFGYVPPSLKEREIKVNRSLANATSAMGGTIGIHDIPYINQVYDVPDSYAGCHGYGSVACAPTTSCMLLAWLGDLSKHAVTSRYSGCPWGQTNYYSWYVGQQYTSNSGNYTFSLVATGNSCSAKGGFGYMWNGSSSPSTKMKSFYDKNDIPTNMTTQKWSITYASLKAQCDADHPYSWCITSGRSNGHLILPFRCNAKCVKQSGVWTLVEGAEGSLVVQDPYGDANNSTWLGDGRYSTYDFSGYNNGHYKMVNAWGVTCSKRPAASAKIKVNPSSITFKDVAVGESASKMFSVTGVNLTDSIHMVLEGTGVSVYTVSPMVLPYTGGDVTITFQPNKAAQRDLKITLLSTNAEDAYVSVTGRAVTPVEEVESVPAPLNGKVIEQGRIYIYRNGVKYDILGNQP